MRWSKVAKSVESLMVPGVKIRPPGSPFMSIWYKGEVVWRVSSGPGVGSWHWPYDGDVYFFKRNLLTYLNTPVDKILHTKFQEDLGYMDVLKMYDKRISARSKRVYKAYCKLSSKILD